ncbi:diaminopimelate epimerase [uncultured Ilumatobacter sp.]|uniref:diaminopimelate epimerase n=1 Tax=uncultured Ilumatobacter sp. TaxID=879968 RepID=UPI00374E8A36
MTSLTLTKHHGLGNDFVVAFQPCGADLSALARRLCDRRTGIGADGLLIAESKEGYAAKMVLYNADGSRAEMSGNGIRCFAQAIAMRHGDLDSQRISTDVGDRKVTLSSTDDLHTISACVEMGDVVPLAEPDGWTDLGCHPDRPVAHLSLGNPHSVVGVDEIAAVDLVELGRKVPQVNLEIVEPGPELNGVTMRVHERGAGITRACGTGACAAAYASKQWGFVTADAAEVLVHMDGGTVSVSFDPDYPSRATLTGPATHVATIEVPLK